MQTMDLRTKLVGTTRSSLILEDEKEGRFLCTNKLFNKLLRVPQIQFYIETFPEHEDLATGKMYPEMRWVVGMIPTKW